MPQIRHGHVRSTHARQDPSSRCCCLLLKPDGGLWRKQMRQATVTPFLDICFPGGTTQVLHRRSRSALSRFRCRWPEFSFVKTSSHAPHFGATSAAVHATVFERFARCDTSADSESSIAEREADDARGSRDNPLDRVQIKVKRSLRLFFCTCTRSNLACVA
jgi:hypothetical protein